MIDWRQFNVSLPKYLEELQKIATKRNGKLLSKNYFGKVVPLLWYCNKHDYKWKAAPNDICGKPSKPNGTWCPKCAKENSAALMKIKTKSYPRDERGKFVSKPP